jgi:hypothetical protein
MDHFIVTRIWAKLWPSKEYDVLFGVLRQVLVKNSIFGVISSRSLMKVGRRFWRKILWSRKKAELCVMPASYWLFVYVPFDHEDGAICSSE